VLEKECVFITVTVATFKLDLPKNARSRAKCKNSLVVKETCGAH